MYSFFSFFLFLFSYFFFLISFFVCAHLVVVVVSEGQCASWGSRAWREGRTRIKTNEWNANSSNYCAVESEDGCEGSEAGAGAGSEGFCAGAGASSFGE
jgi:hypothetical protein